jgi:YD repeat-containing protein
MRFRPRFLALGTVVATAALLGGILPAVYTNASAAAAVTYTYDADGRILTVTNASGTTATYAYDKNGNVTSVTYTTGGPHKRPLASPARPAGPAITAVSPSVVATAGQVTILGNRFDTQASDDLVRIGDLDAPVLSASPSRLVVTAPPGTGGAVNVTTPAGEATSGSVRISGASGPGAVA